MYSHRHHFCGAPAPKRILPTATDGRTNTMDRQRRHTSHQSKNKHHQQHDASKHDRRSRYKQNPDDKESELSISFMKTCLQLARNDATLTELGDGWAMVQAVECGLSWREGDLTLFSHALMGNEHLRSLNFVLDPYDDGNPPSDHPQQYLASTLEAFAQGIASSKLHSLTVAHLYPPMLMATLEGVELSPTVQQLYVLGTKMDMPDLAQRLAVPTPTCAAASSSLVPPLAHRLTHLTLRKCSLNDMDVLTLSVSLAQNHTLGFLNLQHNQITNIGVMYLISHCISTEYHVPSLQHLDLSWNKIAEWGVLQLFQTMSHNRDAVLQTLNLSFNEDIGHQGISMIGELLPHVSCLRHLDVYNCVDIPFQCVNSCADSLYASRSLAQGLRGNTSLESLGIGANNLGSKGVKLILEAVVAHPRLEKLSIEHDCSIGLNGLKHIGKALLQGPPQQQQQPSSHNNDNRLKQLLLDGTVAAWPDRPTKLAHQAGQAILAGVQNCTRLVKFTCLTLDPRWMDPIQVWVDLNETCRPLLRREDIITPAVWPHVLARFATNKQSHIYFCLRENPALVHLHCP